ncbi:MAG: hypothetical protein EZS28_033250, partial [Streblomastix strix]
MAVNLDEETQDEDDQSNFCMIPQKLSKDETEKQFQVSNDDTPHEKRRQIDEGKIQDEELSPPKANQQEKTSDSNISKQTQESIDGVEAETMQMLLQFMNPEELEQQRKIEQQIQNQMKADRILAQKMAEEELGDNDDKNGYLYDDEDLFDNDDGQLRRRRRGRIAQKPKLKAKARTQPKVLTKNRNTRPVAVDDDSNSSEFDYDSNSSEFDYDEANSEEIRQHLELEIEKQKKRRKQGFSGPQFESDDE